MSSESELNPNSIVAIYSLLSLLILNKYFVALLIPITINPVAFGSSVPLCPTFLKLNLCFILLQTSNDVYPFSLLTNRNPLYFSFFSLLNIYFYILYLFFNKKYMKFILINFNILVQSEIFFEYLLFSYIFGLLKMRISMVVLLTTLV